MSYEPTTWKTGDVVTAAKLNKLENGVAEGGGGGGTPLLVHVSQDETKALDKTWQEINDAFMSGQSVIVEMYEDSATIWDPACVSVQGSGEAYFVLTLGMPVMFGTPTPDGYPVYNYQPTEGT